MQAMNIAETFSKASNAKINREKTNILQVGEVNLTRNEKQQLADYLCDEVKILGIYYGKYKDKIKLNYDRVLNKCRKLCDLYKGKVQSIHGRKLIITTFIYPQLWYVGACIHPTKRYMKEFEKILTQFLWYPRRSCPIKTKLLYYPENKGGINLMDFRLRLTNQMIYKIHETLNQNRTTIWKDWAYKNMYLHLRNIAPADTLEQKPFRLSPIQSYQHITKLNKETNKNGGKIEVVCTKVKQIESLNLPKEPEIPLVQTRIPQLNWDEIWNFYASTKHWPAKQRSILYMFLHERIFTNATFLKSFQNRDIKRAKCVYCNKGIETYAHLMLTCDQLKPIIQELKDKENISQDKIKEIIGLKINKIQEDQLHIMKILTVLDIIARKAISIFLNLNVSKYKNVLRRTILNNQIKTIKYNVKVELEKNNLYYKFQYTPKKN